MSLKRAERQNVRCPAILVRRRGSEHGFISDVTVRGLRFEGPDDMRRGTVAEIEVQGMRAAVRIVWVEDRLAGLEFLAPYDPATLSLLRRVIRPT